MDSYLAEYKLLYFYNTKLWSNTHTAAITLANLVTSLTTSYGLHKYYNSLLWTVFEVTIKSTEKNPQTHKKFNISMNDSTSTLNNNVWQEDAKCYYSSELNICW